MHGIAVDYLARIDEEPFMRYSNPVRITLAGIHILSPLCKLYPNYILVYFFTHSIPSPVADILPISAYTLLNKEGEYVNDVLSYHIYAIYSMRYACSILTKPFCILNL